MMGADLLVIKNQDQQEFIRRDLRQRREDSYWIGLHHDGDGWRWVDGEHYNSSLFKMTAESSEGCVLTKSGQYYQDSCHHTYGWICIKKTLKIDLS
ncbi:asialoglycoprotein receptor 1-like [Bufo bufo]|uniref:asialoglycoprotein receptor 1-like n=1 Tax=Bufo bufo TaxID=8384 RepID=UPI001ABDE57B|nr:asialoglycoprotein receptor 1-like [Bufo bufo]